MWMVEFTMTLNLKKPHLPLQTSQIYGVEAHESALQSITHHSLHMQPMAEIQLLCAWFH